jgi:hypothetical protein
LGIKGVAMDTEGPSSPAPDESASGTEGTSVGRKGIKAHLKNVDSEHWFAFAGLAVVFVLWRFGLWTFSDPPPRPIADQREPGIAQYLLADQGVLAIAQLAVAALAVFAVVSLAVLAHKRVWMTGWNKDGPTTGQTGSAETRGYITRLERDNLRLSVRGEGLLDKIDDLKAENKELKTENDALREKAG